MGTKTSAKQIVQDLMSTIKSLRSELSKSKSISQEAARENMALAESNRILTESNVSQQKQIVAYEEKISEVCKHNDECREESKKCWEENKQSIEVANDLVAKLQLCEKDNETYKKEATIWESRYRKSAEDFGVHMHERGELRKPKKQVGVCIAAIATEAGIEDIQNMTIQESKRLGVHLVNILELAR